MLKFNLYKHINNTDVAMTPVSIIRLPNGKLKIKCRWFNIVNEENVFDLQIIDRIVIEKNQLKNWKWYK